MSDWKRLLPLGALAACGVLAGCASEDALFVLDAGLFAPSFDGDVELSDTATTDFGAVDVSSDLDLGGTDYVPVVRGELDVGPLLVGASWFKTSQDGTGTVTADFGAITAGSTVETELDVAIAQGRVIFDFIDTDLVKTGIGVAADWVDLELAAEEQAFGIAEEVDINQIVPLLAVHAAFRIDLPVIMPLRLDLNAAGIQADIEDIDGTLLDLEAILRAELDHFGFFAGYRYVMVDIEGVVDDQDFDGDVILSGWLAGITVRF